MTQKERNRIYKSVLSSLETSDATFSELADGAAAALKLSDGEAWSNSPNGKLNSLKLALGEILSSLIGRGLVTELGGRYRLKEAVPVVIKAAACESKILSMLSERPMSKAEIRARLEQEFGTKRTATVRDDNVLFSYLGQILKRLVNEHTLTLSDSVYSISFKKSAEISDMRAMLDLKNEFLDKLHSKGGEFFEHYFMSLLAKYLAKHGKNVLESYVVGGSADGGIDGIVKTVDCLGFRETIMVQTKNRNSFASETEVRGFYGALCARMGSRGIFVTSSDFHPTAASFLASIDNCVGVNGDKIFEMATECAFGIKRRDGKYIIDEKII